MAWGRKKNTGKFSIASEFLGGMIPILEMHNIYPCMALYSLDVSWTIGTNGAYLENIDKIIRWESGKD